MSIVPTLRACELNAILPRADFFITTYRLLCGLHTKVWDNLLLIMYAHVLCLVYSLVYNYITTKHDSYFNAKYC